MQALLTPCSVYRSADISAAQSTSQTCLPRPAILISASSSIPPIVEATGAAKSGRLLLGRAQASPPCAETFHNTGSLVNLQPHGESIVEPLFLSLPSLHSAAIRRIDTFADDRNATDATSILRSSTTNSIQNDNENTTFAYTSISVAEQSRHRDLTQSNELGRSIMTSTASMPGSPPDLTDSRSSKSSSYGSHSSADNDFSTENITHFEEIGLDDDTHLDNRWNYKESHVQVKHVRRQGLYHLRQPTLPDGQCHPKIAVTDSVPRSVVAGPMKRGFTSPSALTTISQFSRQRSSSPPKRMPRSVSSFPASLGEPAMASSPRSSHPHSRRASWQPQRKTIKEIEAEYDDLDDELPEDASLWNVPISPFLSTSTDVSPRSSFRGSPERTPATATNHQPIPLEHVCSAPSKPSSNLSSGHLPPRQRLSTRSSSASTSRSHPTSPTTTSFLRDARSKSWTAVMDDLSTEARILSQNLEYHADALRLTERDPNKSGSIAQHRSSVPDAIQLPPVQRGPLDFMPISKEKEAVLSRTRPSWLPPKDPREEQKHLREYQKMMAASREAQKKRDLKVRTIQSQKDITRESLSRIWDFYVNPSTDLTVIDRRVNDICWYGVPSSIRGKVWQRTIGNPLGLTSQTYTKALERASAIKVMESQHRSHSETVIASWLADIDRDAETAFPELGIFQRNGPLWQDLVNICEAYTCYGTDTGYRYGLQLIAALVLLQIPEPSEAFVFLANCLNKQVPLAFHTSDAASAQRTYNRVVSNLSVKYPGLHDYLFESEERGGLGLTGQELLEPMFRTMFSNGLDLDRLCRIWDIWVFQGDGILIRSAVAVLGSLQSQIFDINGDLQLKRRNVQEMLGWGPFNRSEKGGYWRLESLGNVEAFIGKVDAVSKLDYTGR